MATPRSGLYDEGTGICALRDTRALTMGRTGSAHAGTGDHASYRDIVMDRANVQRVTTARAWRLVGTSAGRAVCCRAEPEAEMIIVAGLRFP